MKELARKAFRGIATLNFSLRKRDRTDKKILSYLSAKDWSAEHAVVNETFKDLEISKEEYVTRLQKLSKRDFLEYNRPFGSGPFIRITDKGKSHLESRSERILKYLLKNWIVLATLIVAIATLMFSVWVFYENKKEGQFPFFKYAYDPDEQLFQVISGDNIDVIKAEWLLVGKWLGAEEGYTLRKINNLDKELSWFDIRDAYANGLLYAKPWGKDLIECEFFRLTAYAIPVMITVTYDTKDSTALMNNDLLVITRMDTDRPNPQIKLRNVNDNQVISDFFNDNLFAIKQATEVIKSYQNSGLDYSEGIKTPNGKCDILMNQPMEGY